MQFCDWNIFDHRKWNEPFLKQLRTVELNNDQKILYSQTSIEIYFVYAFYIQLIKISGTFAFSNTNTCVM